LKKEFNAHKPSRFKVWLNFLFPPLPKWSGFRTVSFSLVGMAAVVGAVVWFVPSEKKSNQFASVQDTSENKETQNSILDTVSENSELKVNPEQYAELNPISGNYSAPEVRAVEHVHEYPAMDEVREENSIAPTNDAIEAKSDRSMEIDAPTVTESTNTFPTMNFSNDGNLNAPAVQWTTGTNGTTTIVADSVKFQPKKKNKKKTPPKKK
jgi:hypothetical protein